MQLTQDEVFALLGQEYALRRKTEQLLAQSAEGLQTCQEALQSAAPESENDDKPGE